MDIAERYDLSLNARVVLDWSNAHLLAGSRVSPRSSWRYAHRVSVAKINTFARLTQRSYSVPSWDDVGFIGFMTRRHTLFDVNDVVFQCPWPGQTRARFSRRPRACFVGYSTKKHATIAFIGLGYMRYERAVVDGREWTSPRVIEDLINDGLIDVEDGSTVRVVLRLLEHERELASRPLADADVRSYAIEALQAAQAAVR